MRKAKLKKKAPPFPLAAVLKRLGITKYELHKRTGMFNSQVLELARRNANPTWRVIMRIVKALGCSLAEFNVDQD